MKIKMKPPVIKPYPGRPPKDQSRVDALWAKRIVNPCPICGAPVGRRCINTAPSHRASGVYYETKYPHRER